MRISRGPSGYWSYLGTDILLIPRSRATMNLQSFTMSTSESEYKRVVRHEAGHTLAFPHEHMRKQLVARIDKAKAYDYFFRTSRWDRTTVDQQVLTSLDDRSIMERRYRSGFDHVLPRFRLDHGRRIPIRGGTDINSTDFGFADSSIEKLGRPVDGLSGSGSDDCLKGEDVAGQHRVRARCLPEASHETGCFRKSFSRGGREHSRPPRTSPPSGTGPHATWSSGSDVEQALILVGEKYAHLPLSAPCTPSIRAAPPVAPARR